MAKAFIGISGWTFPGWRGPFYPKELPQKRELEYASRKLSSIEINGTFYSLQRPSSFQSWHAQTPENFKFAVKAPQFMTHVLRLKNIEEPLANFMASGILCLENKLGPILWQFPPNVMLKDNRFEKFLKLLPHDSIAASRLAKKHGEKVEGRAWTKAEFRFPIRHAFEFRHPSFNHPDFIALLKEYNVAFVTAHAGGKNAPYIESPTANFVYARLHGEGMRTGYSKKELGLWSKKLESWVKGRRDVFIYFSNEAKKYSPAGAQALQKLLSPKYVEKLAA